jgi:hypothetical protein
VNPAERITVLQGLLARIQKNAALPRPARGRVAAPAPAHASRFAVRPPDIPTLVHAPPPPPPPRAAARPALGPSPLLELDMDDELLRDALVTGPDLPPEDDGEVISLDDADVLTEDAPRATDRDDEERRRLEAEEWSRLEEEARRLEAEEARVAKEQHERIAARKAEEERIAAEAARKADEEARKADEEARIVREAAEAEAARVKVEEDARRAREAAAEAAEAARKVEEERLAREVAEAARLKAEEEARIALEAAEAARRAEEERLALEAAEAARLRAEEEARIALEAEEAARRAEAERLVLAAAEAMRREEAERLVLAAAEAMRREEAERLVLAAAEAARREEEERLARKEAEAARREEEMRRAQEAAERAEAELALTQQLEAEHLAQQRLAEEERLAREVAERATATPIAAAPDEAPPASVRQPRDQDWSLDEALPGFEDEPPASGEVSSQRKPVVHDGGESPVQAEPPFIVEGSSGAALDAAPEPSGEPPISIETAISNVRFVVEPAPPAAPVPALLEALPPLVIEVEAATVRRPPIAGDAASFLGAVRGERPAAFGALLDDALALGA